MTSLRTRRLSGVVAVAAMAAAGLAMTGGSSTAAANGPTMDIQLLSFNDFHGNLETPSGSSGRIVTGHKTVTDPKTGALVAQDVTTDAGGVEYLATHLKEARKGHPYSLTVAAGDLIGASPLLSAAFHDEPTIEAMNSLGLDASAVGNHEFDEGYKELQRMADGGCLDDGTGANNQDSCPGGKTFTGANFDYLAANVVYSGTDKTILPPYTIKNIKGAKIGFIGMTLQDTPTIVTAAGVAGLQFKNEVATANALVPVLRAQGVNAIVVLIHQGGTPNQQTWYENGTPYTVNPTYDYTCAQGGSLAADSPIIPIAKGLDPAIDMIVSGHTHQPYVCDIKDPAGQPRMVTSASSFGRLFTDTELTYDRRTQDIVRTSVDSANMIVTRDVAKDADQTALIDRYKTLVTPIASKVIGHVTTDVTRTGNAGGESQLGDLIADAQLADPSVVTGGRKPDIAFMNPGGIRTDLTYSSSKYGEAPGDITFEEAFNVQPFNNYLVSLDLTGAQVKQLLTEQWSGKNAGTAKKILQVNKGFNYTYSGTTLGTVTVNGQPLVDGQTYRIVTNNFLQGGGDNFPTMAQGTNVYYGGLDIDAFASYLSASSPYTPGALTRITATP
ncbi:bifunctional metallophosphatase/5'-nucleotidase [Phycicoccus sp. 3266]|uniref:bifunctional metallophosphatase/5'-nucleotidase n=1 Tax=Phycicoccus sp. 3266 TaxID=2817751 RepID=UPI002858D6FB|nr:bifunctional metallophosphatase/5'-nucleotidase [Phycicoccus sp. 3266]MDR6862890.1 5'-nucleotidase [Phycicoccus sp. 3266]